MQYPIFLPRPRSIVFQAASVLVCGVALMGLAACGDDDDSTSTASPATSGSPEFRTATPGGSASAAASPSAAATSGSAVAGQQAPTQSSGPATLTITTPDDTKFDKDELDVSAGQQVQVTYDNKTTIPHNIHFFNGPDANSPDLGKSEIGSNDTQTVSFTAPSTPGSYFFHCDVHPDQMTGHLVVK